MAQGLEIDIDTGLVGIGRDWQGEGVGVGVQGQRGGWKNPNVGTWGMIGSMVTCRRVLVSVK